MWIIPRGSLTPQAVLALVEKKMKLSRFHCRLAVDKLGKNTPGVRLTTVRPGDAFLPWLKAYAGERHVYDVGCGAGDFLKRMWAAGIKAMGIDKYADQIEDMQVRMRTLCMDATEARVLRTHPGLVLFCRPNHTGWVADAVVKVHPDSEVLYVSKPGNHYVDLPDFHVEPVDAPGLDVERVWRVLKPYPEFGKPNYIFAGVERLLAMQDGNPMIGEDE